MSATKEELHFLWKKTFAELNGHLDGIEIPLVHMEDDDLELALQITGKYGVRKLKREDVVATVCDNEAGTLLASVKKRAKDFAIIPGPLGIAPFYLDSKTEAHAQVGMTHLAGHYLVRFGDVRFLTAALTMQKDLGMPQIEPDVESPYFPTAQTLMTIHEEALAYVPVVERFGEEILSAGLDYVGQHLHHVHPDERERNWLTNVYSRQLGISLHRDHGVRTKDISDPMALLNKNNVMVEDRRSGKLKYMTPESIGKSIEFLRRFYEGLGKVQLYPQKF
jgi:hypothetical protein